MIDVIKIDVTMNEEQRKEIFEVLKKKNLLEFVVGENLDNEQKEIVSQEIMKSTIETPEEVAEPLPTEEPKKKRGRKKKSES
jgi:hypothetical protein